MAHQSFDEAIKHDSTYAVIYDSRGFHYEGLFANIRIDRETLPAGWEAYDIRDADSNGKPCEIKNGYIFVNHFGTFFTRDTLPLYENESWYTGDFELSFEDGEYK